MSGILKGKDIVDGTITETKLSAEVNEKLLKHAKVTGLDLSADGATGSLSFDGLTIEVTNDSGTFLYITLYSETPIVVDIIRTAFTTSGTSTQRNDNQTIDSSGLQLTPLTQGATVKVQIELITEDGSLYNGWLGSNLDLSKCWGYVEKI